jgi:hypothetical protein
LPKIIGPTEQVRPSGIHNHYAGLVMAHIISHAINPDRVADEVQRFFCGMLKYHSARFTEPFG